jgi:peptidylprolyl isomerase
MTRLALFILGVGLVVGLIYFGWQARESSVYTPDTANAPSLSDISFATMASSSDAIASQPSTSAPINPPSTAPLTLSKERDMVIDAKKKYFAVLHTTSGDITIALHAGETPKTVSNFVNLSQKQYYDNTIFHRVMKGFMIQGGDPLGNGTGGPDYRFDDEPFTGSYERGTVAMANSGPNTNGSQFFIMQDAVGLPPNYVIFGNVVKGIEVVDKIANAAVVDQHGEKSKPVSPVTVKSVDIIEE